MWEITAGVTCYFPFHCRHQHFHALFSPLIYPLSSFLLVTDYCIYWIHRLEHHPAVYKHIHKPHHKWVGKSLFFFPDYLPCQLINVWIFSTYSMGCVRVPPPRWLSPVNTLPRFCIFVPVASICVSRSICLRQCMDDLRT
jgi:Fatty acid hydroxylase superfamily